MSAQSLKKEIRLEDLWKQIAVDRRLLAPYRKHRRDNVHEFVGHNWAEEASNVPVMIPYLTQATNIYLAYIVGGNPEVSVFTRYPQLESQAWKLQEGMNKLIKEIRLRKALRRLLVDAMVGPAIRKAGYGLGPTIELAGEEIADLQIFCDRVSLDDFVIDMTVSNIEEADYMGDFYWARLDDVQNDENFFKDERVKVKAFDRQQYTDQGDELTSSLGHSNAGSEGHYHSRCRLLNLWLRTEGKIVTLVQGQEDLLLRATDYEGPKRGPYDLFGFHYVPDNLIPLCPVAIWKDIHTLANDIYAKLAHQAQNQKTIVLTRKSQEAEGRAIIAAPDLEVLGVMDPNGIRAINFNGPDAGNIGFFIHNERVFMKMNGNIESLGGLGPQAETLGQERLIRGGASVPVNDMEKEFYGYSEEIAQDLAHLLWYHPFKVIPLTKRIPGLPYEINSEFRSDQKEGEFLDYNMEILLGSMRSRSREEQLSQMVGAFRTMIAPFWQEFQAQGAQLDTSAMLNFIADYAHLPQLIKMIRFRGGAPQGQPVVPGSMQRPIQMPEAPRGPSQGRESAQTESGAAAQLLESVMGRAGAQNLAGSIPGA